MRLRDYIVLGWDQLRRRMVVTLLCVMGIAIGSSAIIVALSFGESISHYAREQMNSFLSMDEITVESDGSYGDRDSTHSLNDQKMDIIRQLPHVNSTLLIKPMDYVDFTVDGSKTGSFQLIETDIAQLPEFGLDLSQGTFADQSNGVIISYSAMYDIYDPRLRQLQAEQGEEIQRIMYPLYQKTITLSIPVYGGSDISHMEELPVRVVGILKKPDGAEGYQGDKIAYISPALGERVAQLQNSEMDDDRNTSPPRLTVKVDDPSNVTQVEELIKKLDLYTQSNMHYQETTNTQFQIIRLIFGGAGLFILFVASISIIVAMTMSTYQRRRQIGIMKVLGANLAQIRNMFVVESALLGFIGGLAGILISYWVIWGINIVLQKFAKSDEILFIDSWVLGVGLFFALLTGVASGIYPAVKASKTDALTAIKRE